MMREATARRRPGKMEKAPGKYGRNQDNPDKPKIDIDPDTGYGVLPDGTKVDPVTGEAIDEDTPLDLPGT